jgi:hypothetical protein
MHWRFNLKLITKIRLYVFTHAFPVSSTKQIGLANQEHGAGAGLIESLYNDQIVLREACTRVDQNNAKIAPRQICSRFFGPGNCKGTKPRRIDKGDAFAQPIGR